MGLKYQFELTSPDWSPSKKTDISMQFRRTEKNHYWQLGRQDGVKEK